MMMQFFLPMIPPTATAQEKKTAVRNGKVVRYDDERLKAAKEKVAASLAQHRPDEPFRRGVRLIVKWLFPITGKHRDGEYKLTRPDTDNLQKGLKDIMTRQKFWTDDALVASEIVEKFYSAVPGIWIRIEELNDE